MFSTVWQWKGEISRMNPFYSNPNPGVYIVTVDRKLVFVSSITERSIETMISLKSEAISYLGYICDDNGVATSRHTEIHYNDVVFFSLLNPLMIKEK